MWRIWKKANLITGSAHVLMSAAGPFKPQSQGKIERYHRAMEHVVKPANDCLPWKSVASTCAASTIEARGNWSLHYSPRLCE